MYRDYTISYFDKQKKVDDILKWLNQIFWMKV